MWRFRSLLFALLFASTVLAAAPSADYLPLQVGNRAGAIGGQPVIVEVLDTEGIAGPDGNEFPPGKYTAESWLTTVGDRRYAATARFEVGLSGRLEDGRIVGSFDNGIESRWTGRRVQ